MHFIVVGCGRVGAELALRLYTNGHQVVVIDNKSEAFNNLSPQFRGRTVEGDPMSAGVLERAEIDRAFGLAAVTNSDPLNAVVAHAARSIYNVENIVVRNYDPHLRDMLEAFNFQIVSSASWGAQRIEEVLANVSMRVVFSAGNGEVEVFELKIPDSWVGRSVRDLIAPVQGCLPVAITRGGRSFLPEQETPFESGDLFSVSSTNEGATVLMACLKEKEA